MRTKRWLWRWRKNPLRRGADVKDAAVRLVTALALLLGAPAAGAAVGTSSHDYLAGVSAEQHRDRHRATAVLLKDAPKGSVSDADLTVTGDDAKYWVKVRWSAPDGSRHTGTAQAKAGLKAGRTTPIWLDGKGRLAAEPISRDEVQAQSFTLGFVTALTASGVLLALGWAVLRRLERRRIDSWGYAWAEIGPQWSRENR